MNKLNALDKNKEMKKPVLDFAITQWRAYLNKTASPFYMALFDAMSNADKSNLAGLGRGFPGELMVFVLARNGKVF